MLWWRIIKPDNESDIEIPQDIDAADGAISFGLEKHLHDFLVDNWDHVSDLGKQWSILDEEGEVIGSHYRTGEVGEIDVLAKHRTNDAWLVVELKRNQTSDETVGQVLRYMGWVRRKMAGKKGVVQGLIICSEVDEKLRYALSDQPLIKCMTYKVDFKLTGMKGLD